MYYRNSRLYLDFYSIYSVTAIVYSRKADALPSYSFLKRGNDDKPGIQIKYVTVLAISSVFREEFSSLLELTALTKERLLIVGDFNLGIRETPDDAVLRLLDIADTFGLSQLVATATHESGSILDLVFARMSDDRVRATALCWFLSLVARHVSRRSRSPSGESTQLTLTLSRPISTGSVSSLTHPTTSTSW